MPIAIVPHEKSHEEKVLAFNARLGEKGSPWGFYVDSAPPWIPRAAPGEKRDVQKTWREYHLALEDDTIVRGAYALKPHEWWVNGERVLITDWQGPVSEGVVDPRFGPLGLRMMRDMLKKYPRLYSWGHGGHDEPMLQMLGKMGWKTVSTPFLLRVVNPHAFLRKTPYLRTTVERRVALDALAWTGVGSIGITALHKAMRLRSGKLFRPEYEEVQGFGGWADEIWERCRGEYSAIALRDSITMNALIPSDREPPEWSHVTRLKVLSRGKPIGWVAVTLKKHDADHRFGDLLVGTVVDALGSTEDAGRIVAAGFRFLRNAGADLVFANHSDPRWQHAYEQNGFLALANRRMLAMSPELEKTFAPIETTAQRLFLTNMDGHGPMGL
jgi:hypothetical protein